jgi:hypothetical protein
MLLRTFRVEAAYLSGVYVILILKVWQASKGQQSSTMLNAVVKSMNGVFYPMYGCGRNFKLCHTSTHHGILRFQKIKFFRTLASVGAR